MKAYIVLQCISGLGDQYSSVLSGHTIYRDLTALGYDTEVVWTVNNQYFNSNLPLDPIFDLSEFEGRVYYGIEPEIAAKYIRLPQIQNSTRIYVSEITPELSSYEAPLFCFDTYYKKAVRDLPGLKYPTTDKQFLSKDVLDIVENFRQGRERIKGIHFRVGDLHLETPYTSLYEIQAYKVALDKVTTFLESNNDSEIMVCSNNKNIVNFFENNYNNVFQNKFTVEMKRYYSYSYLTASKYTQEEYIRHAQETAAEMAMFKYCDTIFPYNTFHSSFLTYGITHNIHHKNWNTKLKDLIYE